MEWQTIDTAPKDGTKLLLYFPEYNEPVQVGYYAVMEKIENGKVIERDEYWKGKWMQYQFVRSCSFKADNPTHWLPLPEPPAKSDYARYLDGMRNTEVNGLPELRQDIPKDCVRDTCLDALHKMEDKSQNEVTEELEDGWSIDFGPDVDALENYMRWTPDDFKRNEELFNNTTFQRNK